MIAFGIEAHVAIATNMLALTFMSIGGSIPFIGTTAKANRRRLFSLVLLTILGSTLGALSLSSVPVRILQVLVAVAMVLVAAFSLLRPQLGMYDTEVAVSNSATAGGYVLTFLLAIYGGFFSGGYVTMLTATFVIFFGMTFLQAVGATKVMNVFSSAVATLVFLWRGIVDIKLGIILGMVMFLGALIGGRITMLLSKAWLRRIFVAAVAILALNMLWRLH